MQTSRRTWLATHPFLEGFAQFEGLVEDAAASGTDRPVAPPRWEAWGEDAAAGVPLLFSAAAGVEVVPSAAVALVDLVAALDGAPLPGRLSEPFAELRGALRRSAGEGPRAIEWILAGAPAEGAPPGAGLLKHLAWTATRRVLAPIVGRPPTRGEEDRWGRGHCPTCGAPPALAQLLPEEAARVRVLSCACCGTRWRWRRLACPFCEEEASDHHGVLGVVGEEAVRIDFCDDCHGYVKTYTEQGDEELFLADWATLHLDIAAREFGLRRRGASLYEVPQDERGAEPWPTEC